MRHAPVPLSRLSQSPTPYFCEKLLNWAGTWQLLFNIHSMLSNISKCFNKKTISLTEEVVLRKEPWGGLIFHRKSGIVVDVDSEAFDLLLTLKTSGAAQANELLASYSSKNKTNQTLSRHWDSAEEVLKHLIGLGIVELVRQTSFAGYSYSCETGHGAAASEPAEEVSVNNFKLRKKNHLHRHILPLSVPETVHWAVTLKCLQECPDCYARHHRGLNIPELSTKKALQVVETIAGLKVFQLAIGGGEPLIRLDLPLIAREAKDNGLVVHVTTGITEGFEFQLLKKLAPSIASLHFGINHERLLSQPKKELATLRQLVQAAQTLGIESGANLILCNNVLAHFNQIIDILIQAGFNRVILLRYKPPADLKRWLVEKPSPEKYFGFEAVLRETVKKYPQVNFRLDCALSFLQRHQNTVDAAYAGLRGCVAGNRIMTIGPDGSVYPCSQLMASRFSAGNILADEFQSFWNSKALKRYCHFRESKKIGATKCGVCLAKKHCGGCRVFAHDIFGEDPGCYDPLYPPAQHLDRDGRKAVLHYYMKEKFSISVARYMDYFQVGQKTAVKELKNTDWLMLENEKAKGKKKEDTYIRTDAYLLEDIQTSIGFTTAGFPYASIEEIKEWVKEPEQLDYPQWLLNRQNKPDASAK